MRVRTSRRRRLGVEALETRWLMAGDVTAATSSGSLIISDTAASGGIALSAGSSGQIEVQGVVAGGSSTKVDGLSTAIPFKVTGSVVIDLAAGSDVVDVGAGITIPGSLIINTAGVTDAGNVVVQLGASTPTTAGAIKPHVTALPLTIDGSLVVSTGLGNDQVTANEVSVGQAAAIAIGTGTDTVQLTSLSALALTLTTGNGNNNISLNSVSSTAVAIVTGSGADQVSVVDSNFSQMVITLGAGNDTLSIGDTTVSQHTILNGGSGTNTYTDVSVGAGNSFAGLNMINFTGASRAHVKV